jgi:hypothetical protein
MPVVLRLKGYKFYFYEADVANEPPHVHINKDGNEAKFWLKPIRVERESGIWFFSLTWEHGKDKDPVEFLDDRGIIK